MAAPWHPVLFASVPTLILYAHNVQFIPARQLIIPLAVSLTSTALLWGLVAAILKSSVAAALIVTPWVVALESVGSDYEFLTGYVRRGTALHWIGVVSGVVLLLSVLLAWSVVIATRRRRKTLRLTTRIANIVGAFLVCFNVAVVLQASKAEPVAQPMAACAGRDGEGARPDVYCLILDQYASATEMAAVFGVDNSPFLQWLEDRGFRIARRASSRFNHTRESLVDFLNMGREEVSEGTSSSSDVLISQMLGFEQTAGISTRCAAIRDNPVVARFEEFRYRFVNIGSWWDCTRYNRHAAENINGYGWGLHEELSALLLQSSVVRLFWLKNPEVFRRGVLRQFRAITGEQPAGAPKFVLAHIISPHPPYVFDSAGRLPVTLDQRTLYAEQHRFVTQKVQETVSAILAASPRPPVIILQSDHGSHAAKDFDRSVFSAVYMAGRRNPQWPEDLMARDVFKRVFSELFGCSD